MVESTLKPFALRKAKIVCNFGLSECSRVKGGNFLHSFLFHSLPSIGKTDKKKDVHLFSLKVYTFTQASLFCVVPQFCVLWLF